MEGHETTPHSLPSFLLRWQEHLAASSPSFQALKNEQKLGWESKALDWFYNRQKKAPPTAASASNSTAESDAKTQSGVATASAAPTTYFHGDVESLCDRYRKHAETILQRSDPSFFQKAEAAIAQSFVDLGCAPGGVSAYLALDLNWSGVGVSLPIEDGGIAMTTQLVTSSGEAKATHFSFVGGSILDPALAPLVRMTFVDKLMLSSGSEFPGFDFVNGGAVQDHGQRNSDDSCDERDGPALPWFHFLVPQLVAALLLVRRDGRGNVMVVYGMSQCGSLMLLLHILVALRIIPSLDHVEFLETMHLTKPPIYVMLKGVTPTDASLAKLKSYLLPTMSEGPHEADSLVALSRPTTWAELRSFWRLEGDMERQAASDTFTKCGAKLEALWVKATAYLKSRREKAESVMQSHDNRIAAGGNFGRLKRNRER